MMRLTKFLMISSALLLLTNCAAKPEIVVDTQYIEKNIPTIDRPAGVQTLDVDFIVVTRENLEEVIARFEDRGEFVIIGMSVQDYENLSVNMAELRRYIEQQQAVIVYYEQAVTK